MGLNQYKNKLVSFVLVFIAATVLVVLFNLSFLKQLDDRYNDYWRVKIAELSKADKDIVIIEIDDKSLTEMETQIGRWPWPRSLHGFLVESLLDIGVKAIVFDIMFSEKDLYQPEADEYFSQVVSGQDNIFFAAALLAKDSPLEGVSISELPTDFFYQRVTDSNRLPRVKINLPGVIAKKDWNIGLINFLADADGVARRYPVYWDIDGGSLWSLPKKIANFYAAKKKALPQIEHSGIVNLKYHGLQAIPYQSISYSDVWQLINSGQSMNLFANKIVIVGATATGLHDLQKSPISALYPATSILATALDNMINNDYLEKTDRIYGMTVLFLLVILLVSIIHMITSYRRQMAFALLQLLFVGIGLHFFSRYLSTQDILFPSASIFLLLSICVMVMILYRGLDEYMSRLHTLKTFSRFMDPVVVKKLISEENWQQKISNKTTEISVLFSDIRGFTSLSEKRNAEQVMQILNGYFDLQVEAIFNTRGTLDKFIGDAIMAFWGAPLDDKQHAVNAVNAALQMVDNLLKFRESLAPELRQFDVGIGVHTGDAVVGMLGSSRRYDYTAIGDTVNLASRIEGATKGVARVLVSEDTRQRCGDAFNFYYRGEFAVKGREQKVKLFEPEIKS